MVNRYNALETVISTVKSTAKKTVAFAVISLSLSGCSSPGKPAQAPSQSVMLAYQPDAVNAAAHQDKPYVILLSIDGYRFDYNKKFSPPNLSRLEQEGVSAASLMPVYPSKTFPNHYSLATGLYAKHHGIVSNEFYSPERDATYSLPDRNAVEDGSWYQGEPLWIAVQKEGVMSASFFWVGSEANIQGMYPNYYYRYDETVPNLRRVDQVLEWLKYPNEKRPHMITLYFSDVDTAGHRYGTESEQLREAVMKVDEAIGRLREGIAKSELPINLIVVSDHGMENLDPQKVILIDETPEVAKLLEKFRVVGRGPQMNLYLNKGEDPRRVRDLTRALAKNAKNYRVMSGPQLKRLDYDSNPRTGDIVIEPEAPFSVGLKSSPPSTRGGNHGWDARKTKTMHGIFYASGPAFREKTKLRSFELIHVYPMVMKVLGLPVRSRIDGHLEPTARALKP